MKNTGTLFISVIFIFIISVLGSAATFAGPRNHKEDLQGVYGDDNRRDLFEVSNPTQLKILDSTVALMSTRNIRWSENESTVILPNRKYADAENLCSTERFYDQPTGAFCSGSLIAPDVVLTAGHCIDEDSCGTTVIAFGFSVKAPGVYPTSLPSQEVYRCKSVLGRAKNDLMDSDGNDYALIELDRPVPNHEPLAYNLKKSVNPGTIVYVTGHPSGIPVKLTDQGIVRADNPIFFRTNLDTYGGNSGSPVFDASTDEIVGILVRGGADFEGTDQGCRISVACTWDTCRGEDVTHVSAAKADILAAISALTLKDLRIDLNLSSSKEILTFTVFNGSKVSVRGPIPLSLKIQGTEIKASLPSLARGDQAKVSMELPNLNPEALAQGIAAQISMSSPETGDAGWNVTLKQAPPYSVLLSEPKVTTQVTKGSANVQFQVTNTSQTDFPQDFQIQLLGPSRVLNEKTFPPLKAGQTLEVTFPVSGLSKEGLAQGIEAQLRVTLGKYTLSKTPVKIQGFYPFSFQFGTPNLSVNLCTGTGQFTLPVINSSDVAQTEALSFSVKLRSGTSVNALVPVLSARATGVATADITGINPLEILKVDGNEFLLFASISDGIISHYQKSHSFSATDRTSALIAFFNESANLRCQTGQSAQSLSTLINAITQMNLAEVQAIKKAGTNPYSDAPLTTTLGLLVASYTEKAQTPQGIEEYKKIARAIEDHAKELNASFFSKGATRKAYEALWAKLPK